MGREPAMWGRRWRCWAAAAVVLAVCGLAGWPVAGEQETLEVLTVEGGRLRGEARDGVRSFKGIP